MKWFFATVAMLMLTGCGDFEWFPTVETFPTISSFSPTNALPGTAITINGTNFSATPTKNIVKFNGTTAVVTSATSSQIVTTVPTGATTGSITVTVGNNTATSATNFTVTALLAGAVQGYPLALSNRVTTIAGTAGINGSTDGSGMAASFAFPAGITTDGANLYVADSSNSTIRKIVITTRAVSTVAGTAGNVGADDGTGAAASFANPFGITTDGTNLYISDTVSSTIRKIVIATGDVSTLAGTAGNTGSADGIGVAASFDSPFGITTDGTNLYVVDSNNSTIRKIVIATGEVSTFAGIAGEVGSDDGIGSAARFNTPYGITTDGTSLYITDSINCMIRKIVIATRTVSTLAGTVGNAGSEDGTGAGASFNTPYGITTDGTNLYIADTINNTIRKMVIATRNVSTIAGIAGNAGVDDGSGSAASFVSPIGIITDGTNLYVTDLLSSTIREIQ